MTERSPHPAELSDDERKEQFIQVLVDVTKNQDTHFLVNVWSPLVEKAGFDRAELMTEAMRRLEEDE